MKKYKYIIHTGWWCEDGDNSTNRKKYFGDELQRKKEFHNLWYKSICAFTDPDKIIMIDSASPVKPDLHTEDNRIEFLSLPFNAGHSTILKGVKLAGVSRSYMLGAFYAFLSDIEYYVYVEQDVLLYGEGIIEKCIDAMNCPYMFGDGNGTPQALQQSLFIIRKDGIIPFINNYLNIKSPDDETSPETKFALATNQLLKIFPKRVINSQTGIKLFKTLSKFQNMPIGYGRCRPINFNDGHFYFQHGSKDEINSYLELTGFDFKTT